MTDICKRKYKILHFGGIPDLQPYFGIVKDKDIDGSKVFAIYLGWKFYFCRRNTDGSVVRGWEHEGNLSEVGQERIRLFKIAQKQICK